MTPDPSPRRPGAAAILLAAIFVLVAIPFGAMLGVAYVRFAMPPAADGWTGIAQGLGGLMVGGAAGLIVSLLLLVPLLRRGAKTMAAAVGLTVAGTGAVVLLLFLTQPQRKPSPPLPPPPKAFQPLFRVSVRIGLSDELLRGMTADDTPLRRASYKVETYGRDGPHLDVESFGPTRQVCSASLSEADLRSLLETLRPATNVSSCRTPVRTPPIAFSWTLKDVDPSRGNAAVEVGCLPERPALEALIAALEALAVQQERTLLCRAL